MAFQTLSLFLASSLALAITPGPTMLLALSNGLRGGTRIAAFGIAGVTLVNGCLILIMALGLGALFATSPYWFNAIRLFGIIYLCFLGYGLWKAKALSIQSAETQPKLSAQGAFLKSAGVAASNPKALLFFGAFFPQFIDKSHPQHPQYLTLGLLFLSIDALIMLSYVLAGTYSLRLLSVQNQPTINRGCAIAMFIMAGLLIGIK